MEKLTTSILLNLVGQTIYWQMPDGPDGIMTILCVSETELKTQTINGADFDPKYIDLAVFKSYGRFMKM